MFLKIAANLSNQYTGSVFVPLTVGIWFSIKWHKGLAWNQQISFNFCSSCSLGNLDKILAMPRMIFFFKFYLNLNYKNFKYIFIPLSKPIAASELIV